MSEKTKERKSENEEREYTIPLRKKLSLTPKHKRANKAIRKIKEFIAKHMKIRDRDLSKIKIDTSLNEIIWMRGIKKPPARIRVRVITQGEKIIVEPLEIPEKIKFRKLKIEKRHKVKKREEKNKEEEKKEEAEKKIGEEEKEVVEKEEKKAAVIEEGKEIAKESAKKTKHETKILKQPKRQFRQALRK
ncbi:MAG: 50S ribosomal protein L31e [Candidatus Pacearchaeota archaeon]